MASFTASMLFPSKFKPSISEDRSYIFPFISGRYHSKRSQSFSPVMRLLGPAILEASKLKVLYLGVDEEKLTPKLPRTYTLTRSDITSKLIWAVSQTINNSEVRLQGWSNKLYRDEVVAEWKKVKGKMGLHVHCHISGGHFLLNLFAPLRYYIFCKELPVVLNAFVQGDENLFRNNPELQEALVWVYLHSNIPEFNKVKCWGSLKNAFDPKTSKTESKITLTIYNHPQEKQEDEIEKVDEKDSTITKNSK